MLEECHVNGIEWLTRYEKMKSEKKTEQKNLCKQKKKNLEEEHWIFCLLSGDRQPFRIVLFLFFHRTVIWVIDLEIVYRFSCIFPYEQFAQIWPTNVVYLTGDNIHEHSCMWIVCVCIVLLPISCHFFHWNEFHGKTRFRAAFELNIFLILLCACEFFFGERLRSLRWTFVKFKRETIWECCCWCLVQMISMRKRLHRYGSPLLSLSFFLKSRECEKYQPHTTVAQIQIAEKQRAQDKGKLHYVIINVVEK